MSNAQLPGNPDSKLPEGPIGKLVKPIVRFMHIEAAGGIVLLICTAAALVLANLDSTSKAYQAIWETKIEFRIEGLEHLFHPNYSIKHIINDGLMVLFFFVVGLEVKRELVLGELRGIRKAALPVAAAVGGMVVPALIYLVLQFDQPGQRGWGIPMATDIAFVVGCMALLGKRVPYGLRVMVLSLAIVDDIGAILVIAVGYTSGIVVGWLLTAAITFSVAMLLRWLGVRNFLPYVIVGLFLWLSVHESKIHATIAGVILGLLTPANQLVSESLFSNILEKARDIFQGDWEKEPHKAEKVQSFQWVARETVSPLEYLMSALHPWTSFVVLPLFALANAGVPVKLDQLGSSIGLAVILGLVLGKPLGITFFSWVMVRLGLGELPKGSNWGSLVGAGFLAGIGFTMALFIAGLAFAGEGMGASLDTAKIGILAASVIAAVIGMILMWLTLSEEPKPATDTASVSESA